MIMTAEFIVTGNVDMREPSKSELEAAEFLEGRKEDTGNLGFGAFSHISPMREAAICWYPFREHCTILETHGGMGELTGQLCRTGNRVISIEQNSFCAHSLYNRHKSFGNLIVINGDFPENPKKYNLPSEYDYIVCMEPKKPCVALFNKLVRLLSLKGRLILTLPNRYGLRYWCGARGGVGGQPFGSLERAGDMLSRVELIRQLERAGFTTQKWYYPLPEHRFTRAVYSDKRLPNRFFGTISPLHPTDGAGTYLREDALAGGVVDGGAFPFMANSFIIEAAIEADAKLCPVDFAAVTAYRNRDRAFITAVYTDKTAQKTALYPEGVLSLEKMAENHSALAAVGLKTLPIRMEGRTAHMPAMEYETLWEFMQRRISDGYYDHREFIEIFDKLRDQIIKSSKLLPSGSGGWDERFGPVQETAYLELVPANCFYDEKNDDYIFFDQEHAIKNCPYSVPLSRAILSLNYSSVLNSHEETRALLQELIRRYGLSECWEDLLDIEGRFLYGLFNREAAIPLDTAVSESFREIARNRNIAEELAAVWLILKEYKNVGVYGLGVRGRRFCNVMEHIAGVPAVFKADKKTGGLPVGVSADVIVVTPKKDACEIAEELRTKTDIPVLTINEVFERVEII